MKSGHSTAPRVILEVGAEGGSIRLRGVQTLAGWRFKSTMNEAAILVEDEAVTRSSRWVSSLTKALATLDRYPWARLYPLSVHPSFRTRIAKAVKERLDPSDHYQLDSWRRLTEAGERD